MATLHTGVNISLAHDSGVTLLPQGGKGDLSDDRATKMKRPCRAADNVAGVYL